MSTSEETSKTLILSSSEFLEEKQHYQKKVKSLQSIIDGHRRTIEKLESLIKNLKTQRTQSDNKNIKLYDQVKQLKNVNESLSRKNIDLKIKITELENNLAKQTAFLSSSTRSLSDNSEMEQIKAFNQRLLNQNIQLKQKLARYDMISSQRSNQDQQIKQQLKKANQNNYQLQRRIQQLMEQIKAEKQECQTLRKKNKQLESQFNTSKLQTVEINRQEFNSAEFQLKEQVENLKKDLKKMEKLAQEKGKELQKLKKFVQDKDKDLQKIKKNAEEKDKALQKMKKIIAEKEIQMKEYLTQNDRNQQEKTKLLNLLNTERDKTMALKSQCQNLMKQKDKLSQSVFMSEDQMQGLIYKFHQLVKQINTVIREMEVEKITTLGKNGKIAVKNVMKVIVDQQFKQIENN